MLWIAGCAHAFQVKVHQTILGATFGASAVLLYGVMESKLAQPRNVIGVIPALLLHHRVQPACNMQTSVNWDFRRTTPSACLCSLTFVPPLPQQVQLNTNYQHDVVDAKQIIFTTVATDFPTENI